jgi:hypothetical protein
VCAERREPHGRRGLNREPLQAPASVSPECNGDLEDAEYRAGAELEVLEIDACIESEWSEEEDADAS